MSEGQVIRLVCPNLKCRAILSVPGSARGKTVKCRYCGSRLSVPSGSGSGSKPDQPSAAAK